MPSMLHEAPLDLMREHPEIAVELVRGTAGIELPDQASETGARQVLDAMASTSVSDTDRLRMTVIILS